MIAEALNLCSWVGKDSQHGRGISAPDHVDLVAAEGGTGQVELARCFCAGFMTRPDGLWTARWAERGGLEVMRLTAQSFVLGGRFRCFSALLVG